MSRVNQNSMNYYTFVSVLEEKQPSTYYRTILLQLNDAVENAKLDEGLQSCNDVDNAADPTLRKYCFYIIVLILAHLVVNIILRFMVPPDILVV